MSKKEKRLNRKKRVRANVKGVSNRPRLTVFRSNKYVYAQIIDDVKGETLVSSYGTDAQEVGKDVAKLAKKRSIDKVVFDRSGYKYHGKVKALCEAAREGGLVV